MTPKEKRSTLTAEWLREHMAYVPETGTFMWKVRGPGRTVGKVLGSTMWDGYLTIKVNNVLYYAHRLAWFYVHGEWPDGQVDHIDGTPANNAISNLRIATPSQNAARRPSTRKHAPSRGVFPQGPGFVARVHRAGKRHYLGYFSTAEAARQAYETAATKIYGEFAYEEKATPFDAAVAEAVKRSPHRDWLLVATPGFGVSNG